MHSVYNYSGFIDLVAKPSTGVRDVEPDPATTDTVSAPEPASAAAKEAVPEDGEP